MQEHFDFYAAPDLAWLNSATKEVGFDDIPMEGLLDGSLNEKATPVDLFEQWQAGSHAPGILEGVVAILANRPNLAEQLKDIKNTDRLLRKALETAQEKSHHELAANICQALSAIAKARACLDDSIQWQNKAIGILKKHKGIEHENTLIAIDRLIELLKFSGQHKKAEQVYRNLQIDLLLEKGIPKSFLKVRNMAYKYFSEGEFFQAEGIYRILLEREFEIPGTLSHLARVLLAMPDKDNRAEALDCLNKACEKKHLAPEYVPPRILYWMIFLKMVAGEPFDEKVRELKKMLQKGKTKVCLDYTVMPVLDRWGKSLSDENYEILKKFGQILSGNLPVSNL